MDGRRLGRSLTPFLHHVHSLRELWAVLNFLMPDVFDEGSEPIFTRSFNLADRIVDADMLGKAHALLQPFMLRRLKVR